MKMFQDSINILHQDGIAIYHEKVVSDEQIKQFYGDLLNTLHWENERYHSVALVACTPKIKKNYHL
jgi:predicted HicB family RNase H-like nuclease